MRRPVSIAPPKGKLGVLTPGNGSREHHGNGGRGIGAAGALGARWLVDADGNDSLGQDAPKRAWPKTSEFVKLAGLKDLVFGGWDIYPDSAFSGGDEGGRARL